MERGCGSNGELEVSIACEGTDIITVPQRDLFSKYDWPAEEPILEALNKFKAEVIGADRVVDKALLQEISGISPVGAMDS